LLHSGNYHIWSLTWDDVENVFTNLADYYSNYLLPSRAPQAHNFEEFMNVYDVPVVFYMLNDYA